MNDATPHPDELTPQEQEAYEGLPREREPGDLLEERVVRALKVRGLLQSGPSGTGARKARRWTPAWTAAAAAAALVLFLSGLGLGQWMGARSAATTFLALQEEEAAARVQATGTEYVRSLTRFAEVSRDATEDEMAQGRQAALGALLAAAEIVVRLEADDPELMTLLRFLEERRDPGPVDTAGTRKIYWF